jgi:hypothetical protein
MSAAATVATAATTAVADFFVEHSTGDIELSAYHFHHNRSPFIIMFSKKGKNIYIEKVDPHSYRNKYVNDIVMPFEEMEKNESLKKFYEMSVMMVNTGKSVYYDNVGLETGQLVPNYDTDSEDEEGEEVVLRRWCINCDRNWKNMRVSKPEHLNCYFNINPLTFEYNVNTEKRINSFMKSFDAFAKYNNVCTAVKNEIIANYNNKVDVADEV